MKAIRISASAGDGYHVVPFGLPAVHRYGAIDPVPYRRQARSAISKANRELMQADAFRTIALSGGCFMNFASQPGALLTLVIAGKLAVDPTPARPFMLEPGDVLLTDEQSAAGLSLHAAGQCRLLQFGVAGNWPDSAPPLDVPGTIIPRNGDVPNIKRLFTGDENRSCFSHFPELFSGPRDRWTSPCPVQGFGILCWEDSELDWHPCVSDQLVVFLSGETQVEVGGDGGSVEIFRAGDICLAEDRIGEGHIDRVLGAAYAVVLIVEPRNLWQAESSLTPGNTTIYSFNPTIM
jgi:hypothetical protein